MPLLSLPRKGRRARSKARSETDAIQGPNESGLAVPRPTESGRDLGIGPSILRTFAPPTMQNRVSSGTWAVSSREMEIHLTVSPPHRWRRLRPHPVCYRKDQTSEAMGSYPQLEHRHKREQAWTEFGVHCVSLGQGGRRCSQGILGHFPSAQGCCGWSYCNPQTS